RKHPLEIPPPSEKDWLKEEEDFFLQDPNQKCDVLPQPFRIIIRLVMLVFQSAMEIIERMEMLREEEKLKVQPTKCFLTIEFQVTGSANCLAASGKYIFVGVSVGLATFRVSDCKEVCVCDTVNTDICAIHASDLGNELYVLLAVDKMGIVWLFCFHKERFLLVKILNEMEDITKRSTCVEVVLSPGGDYAGVLLQGNTKAWLEIYRLPKDSWLKETAKNPGAAAGLVCRERRSNWTSAVQNISFSHCYFLLQPFAYRAGSPSLKLAASFLAVLPHLKNLCVGIFPQGFSLTLLGEGEGVGSSVALAWVHYINSISKDISLDKNVSPKTYNETVRALMKVGFVLDCSFVSSLLLSCFVLSSVPDVSAGISVHWDGSHNLCFYLLKSPLKEDVDSDLKPDVVWPCASPVACSAVSPCSRYLALACEDAAITIWDEQLGCPLSVTAILEERLIYSVHFL
ncbi:WDR93 protein, partial [Rhinopomastus cyanomelas]|nr:WDR93 protein [Rhinopomastus cyanomelas]